MEIDVETNGTSRTLRIQGEMTIFTASRILPEIATALELCDSVVLDLSAVTEMDSAGLQLLIKADTIAQRQRKSLLLREPAREVMTVLELCELKSHLNPVLYSWTSRPEVSQ